MLTRVTKLSVPLRVVTVGIGAMLFALSAGRACYYASMGASLRQAAGAGEAAQVVYWLNRGADINARDTFGDTPLMYAARGAHPLVARTLLARGATVGLRDDFGLSAARWATFHALDCRAVRCVNGIEIRQVPRPDALQTLALLSR